MKKRKNKSTWIWEFSKKIIFVLTILFVLERIFSAVIIYMNDGMSLDTYITTGMEVFLASVVGYLVKSAFENVTKIKKTTQENGEDEV